MTTHFSDLGERALNKAFEYIDAMAAKLGVASEHVYGILVRQAKISGTIGLILSITTMTVLAVIFVNIINNVKKAGDEDDLVLTYIVGGIIVTFVFGVIFLFVFNGANKLLNPEYYAIREILEVISGGD